MLISSLLRLPLRPDGPAANEIAEVLTQGPACRIQRIVSFGQSFAADFRYGREEDKWATLPPGRVVLDLDRRTQTLHTGQPLPIPARQRRIPAYTGRISVRSRPASGCAFSDV